MITIQAVKTSRTKLRRDITAVSKWLDKNVSGQEAAMMRQQLEQMQVLERTLTLRVEQASDD